MMVLGDKSLGLTGFLVYLERVLLEVSLVIRHWVDDVGVLP